MQEVSVIIPNFNGMAYLDGVLAGLECQTVNNFEVFDLFNKMSGYSYTINAQMQQETYTNLLRRYAMLSLTYKFSQKKKHTK